MHACWQATYTHPEMAMSGESLCLLQEALSRSACMIEIASGSCTSLSRAMGTQYPLPSTLRSKQQNVHTARPCGGQDTHRQYHDAKSKAAIASTSCNTRYTVFYFPKWLRAGGPYVPVFCKADTSSTRSTEATTTYTNDYHGCLTA